MLVHPIITRSERDLFFNNINHGTWDVNEAIDSITTILYDSENMFHQIGAGVDDIDCCIRTLDMAEDSILKSTQLVRSALIDFRTRAINEKDKK